MSTLRLKEIMLEKQVSREDISKALNVSMATISSISSGKVLPSIKFTLKLAEFLDVDIREMFVPTKGTTNTQSEMDELKKILTEGLRILNG